MRSERARVREIAATVSQRRKKQGVEMKLTPK